MAHTPSNSNYINVYQEWADGDPATASNLNSKQVRIADNIEFLSASTLKNIKTCIFNYLKTFDVAELDPVSLAVTLTNGLATFTYNTNTELLKGDFLIFVNSLGEVEYDYIKLVAGISAAPGPFTYTTREAFGGTTGVYATAYIFRLDGLGESRYFKDYNESLVDLMTQVRAAILDGGGRLKNLNENILTTSLGLDPAGDGTKLNFTSTNIIGAGNSFYTAINSLDKSHEFISDIEADVIAKIGYTGTHSKILQTLALFGTSLGGEANNEYNVTGLITGNDDTGSYSYPATDNGVITLDAADTCCNLTIKAVPHITINGTLEIILNKVMSEVVIDGLEFSPTGKLEIIGNADVYKLTIKNCNGLATADRADYWLDVDLGGHYCKETIFDNNFVNMNDPNVGDHEFMSARFKTTDTANEGLLTLRNNRFLGECFFQSANIISYNNIYKCGNLDTTSTYPPIIFQGNLKTHDDKFYMINKYPEQVILDGYAMVHVSQAGFCQIVDFSDDQFINGTTAPWRVFPRFLKFASSANMEIAIENNSFFMKSDGPLTEAYPVIETGNYRRLKFNKNTLEISETAVPFLVDECLIDLANLHADAITDFLNNTLQYYDNSIGLAPGEYASVVKVNHPGKLFRFNDNLFIFEHRNTRVRLLHTETPVDQRIFADTNKYQVLGGAEFNYTDAVDDWIYAQDDYIDDGSIIIGAQPSGDIADCDFNWAAAIWTSMAMIDCGGYHDGGINLIIKKPGIYIIQGACTFTNVLNGTRRELRVNNNSAIPIMGVAELVGKITGNGFVNSSGGPIQHSASLSTTLFLEAGVELSLSIQAAVRATDNVQFSIRRIN